MHTNIANHFLIAAIAETTEFLEDSFSFRALIEPVEDIHTHIFHVNTRLLMKSFRCVIGNVMNQVAWTPHEVATFYSLLNLCFNGVMVTQCSH